MADISIQAAKNGPLLVQGGDVTLKDSAGEEIPTDGTFALCRCGQSGNKPLCDGTHGPYGFESEVAAEATETD